MPREKTNDQWTAYDPPWVEEIDGEPFRYRVQSMSGDSWHLVDLTEGDGQGACDCHHFGFTALPNRLRHGMWIPYAPSRQGVSECKHIRAAFDHYHKYVTMPMLAQFQPGIRKKP